MTAKNSEQELRFAELSFFDQKVRRRGFKVVAGIDEAGRGPLAGPVVAAACVLPTRISFIGIDDSKKLTAQQRSALFSELTSNSKVKYGIGIVSSQEIDEINIYQATLRAMCKAVAALAIAVKPDLLLVDGNVALKHEDLASEAVVGGDAQSLSIAAASVLAKVTRDRLMQEFHVQWPQYGFDRHKGYATAQHLDAIKSHGPSPIHRLSFSPIKGMAMQSSRL